MTAHVGIDVGQKTLVVALEVGEQRVLGRFSNTSKGFQQLQRWLAKRKVTQAHVCMEATGGYWEEVALYLHGLGLKVSVVNPRQVKSHGQARMQRTKNDDQDAWLILDFCQRHNPPAWTPPSPAYYKLRSLVRYVEALKEDRTRELNRLKAGRPTAAVGERITAHIAFLDQQIKALEAEIEEHIDQDPDLRNNRDLLISIPGIGQTTAARFLAEAGDVRRFASASQLVAFAGLCPGIRQSGTSLNSSGRLVKWGQKHLRTAFYMPALAAHRWNPDVACLYERLQSRGKKKMTMVVAKMRKLLVLCYGVLKTQTPYCPNYAAQLTPAA
jgi:transposase